jgi:exosome complex component RRP4
MLIGQNGVVVIVGSAEDTLRAIKAITLVEEEAHSADLTERVQKMLGMEVTPEPQTEVKKEGVSSDGEGQITDTQVASSDADLSSSTPVENEISDGSSSESHDVQSNEVA